MKNNGLAFARNTSQRLTHNRNTECDQKSTEYFGRGLSIKNTALPISRRIQFEIRLIHRDTFEIQLVVWSTRAFPSRRETHRFAT